MFLSFCCHFFILLSFWEWENEELALGNLFLGLPGRGVVSRLRVQAWGEAGSKTGWAGWGRGEMARGAAQGREAGSTWKLKNATLPARESFFCIFLHVFCVSQTGSNFFVMFFAFP